MIRRVSLLGVIGLLSVRFLFPSADFPWGFTWSGAPYTDEGWYSNAAVRDYLGADWYLPGDVNEAVVQPVFHVLQRLNFAVAGMSLASARRLAMLLFGLLVVATFWFLRVRLNWVAAISASVLLSSNYTLFVYSRVAMVDLPMTVFALLSLYVVFFAQSRSSWFVFGSGLLYLCAFLTKWSAVFAFPGLVYASWITGRSRSEQWRRAGGFFLGSVVPLGVFAMVSRSRYPEDWRVFLASSLGGLGSLWRGEGDLVGVVVEGTLRFGRNLLQLEPLLQIALAALVVLAAIRWRDIKNQALLKAILLLLGGMFVALLESSYQPPRYLVPTIALQCLFVGTLVGELFRPTVDRFLPPALITGLSLLVLASSFEIVSYLSKPHFSLLQLCTQVRQVVTGDRMAQVLLMGDMAPQVSLCTGIPAISGFAGTHTPQWRFEQYRPSHFISRGPLNDGLAAILSSEIESEERASFSVYDDSYMGRVHIYSLSTAGP